MGKKRYNIDHINEVVNNPLYKAPRLPQQPQPDELVLPILRQNSNADANDYLQSLPATMALPYGMRRGNINPEDIQETPYRNKVTSWYANHPNGIVYATKNPDEFYLNEAFPVDPNLSNYRKGYNLATDKAVEQAMRTGRHVLGSDYDMEYNIKYPQADVHTPTEAGKYIADYNRLKNAISDWRAALKNSPYLDSFYDQANGTDDSWKLWNRGKDAKLMEQALIDCNGDVERAFEKIIDANYGVSDGAYNAIMNMIGYDENIKEIQKDRTSRGDINKLRRQTAQRFFNAYNAARSNYDIDGSRPSSNANYYYDKEAYDDYMRQSAANDLRLSDRAKAAISQNQYARGGHLRTPNTIRSRNGLKMRRADDLGSADYDIYF